MWIWGSALLVVPSVFKGVPMKIKTYPMTVFRFLLFILTKRSNLRILVGKCHDLIYTFKRSLTALWRMDWWLTGLEAGSPEKRLLYQFRWEIMWTWTSKAEVEGRYRRSSWFRDKFRQNGLMDSLWGFREDRNQWLLDFGLEQL